MPTVTQIDGLILAGGRASRFGGDKVLHPVDGVPMLVRVHDVLAPLVRRVWISVARERNDLPVDAPQVVDLYADAGPLAGLHAGLLATDAPAVLVLAVDLPSITPEVMRRIRDAEAGPDVPVVARGTDGRLQPLCGRYPRTVLPVIAARLEAGRRSVHGLLEVAPGPVVVEVEASALRNVNHRS
ncbi:MAG TPA: molybdenum cofactor guanylyltransferase [Rhodothermales bacterium]